MLPLRMFCQLPLCRYSTSIGSSIAESAGPWTAVGGDAGGCEDAAQCQLLKGAESRVGFIMFFALP